MLAAVVNHQFHGAALLPGLRLKPLGLIQRHQRIGVAVVDQRRRQIRVHVKDRRHLVADDLPGRQVRRSGAEAFHEALGRTAVAEVLSGLAQVQAGR